MLVEQGRSLSRLLSGEEISGNEGVPLCGTYFSNCSCLNTCEALVVILTAFILKCSGLEMCFVCMNVCSLKFQF